MKTNSLPYLKAGLAAALITPVFALEAPADDSPPPPALEQEAAKLPEIKLLAQPEPAAAMAQTAFLGVVSGHVPEVLADHLNLKPGEGIIVRSLVPDGPAAKAGITVNDVITRVAGQAVGSPLEITRQIASHQPGESISLELIRKGKSVKLDVALGLKPAEMAALDPQSQEPLNLENIPKELADRLRKAIEGNLGGMDLHLDDEEGQIPPRMDEAMRDLRKRLQGAMGQAFIQPADDDAGKVQVQSGATIRMKDNQGCVEVKSKDGSKEVTIRDQQDQITWSGPWDTAQDKAAAPPDVRQRVDGLNIDSDFKGNGLRLHMRQAPPPNAPGN
jgi:hypothetical protein